AFVKAPETAVIVAANYVVVNLTVEERDDKKSLETPGGEDKKTAWGGGKSGLPFYVFLDAAGRKIADSNALADGSNIGFPATREEIAAFLSVIDKTARHLSRADRKTLENYLVRVMPKPKSAS